MLAGYDSFRGTVLLQEVGRPWLIAFSCGRKGGGDASGRTLFLRRSSDGGRSWDLPRVWATASNASLAAGDGVYMGSAVYDTKTNTSMILWGQCLEACKHTSGRPPQTLSSFILTGRLLMRLQARASTACHAAPTRLSGQLRPS